MTNNENKLSREEIKSLMEQDNDFLKRMVHFAVQEVLEAEMSVAAVAEKSECTEGRQGYRSGYGLPVFAASASLCLNSNAA